MTMAAAAAAVAIIVKKIEWRGTEGKSFCRLLELSIEWQKQNNGAKWMKFSAKFKKLSIPFNSKESHK